MTRRSWIVVFGLALLLTPLPAQAQQSVDINVGGFIPWAEDGRAPGDVLVVNRSYLLFDFGEFNRFYGEAAWSIELGKFFEAGVGVGFSQKTVPSIYADYTHSGGREIMQDLKLRNTPLTVLIRAFPLGHRRIVQPYVGGGLAVHFWRYSETGEFVDFTDYSIFRDSFAMTGTTAGPVGVFGVRSRVASQADLGIELRYQWAEGALNQDFLGDKIDLGGYSILGTFKLRF